MLLHIHQVYRAKPVQTFGDPEAKLLQEPAVKQQRVLSQVNKFDIELLLYFNLKFWYTRNLALRKYRPYAARSKMIPIVF